MTAWSSAGDRLPTPGIGQDCAIGYTGQRGTRRCARRDRWVGER